jgi:hypothetical protein
MVGVAAIGDAWLIGPPSGFWPKPGRSAVSGENRVRVPAGRVTTKQNKTKQGYIIVALQSCVIVALQGCIIVALQGCMIVVLQGCMIVVLQGRVIVTYQSA